MIFSTMIIVLYGCIIVGLLSTIIFYKGKIISLEANKELQKKTIRNLCVERNMAYSHLSDYVNASDKITFNSSCLHEINEDCIKCCMIYKSDS